MSRIHDRISGIIPALKIRGKLVIFTSLFIGVSATALLYFFIQYANQNINRNNEISSDLIYESVKNTVENYFTRKYLLEYSQKKSALPGKRRNLANETRLKKEVDDALLALNGLFLRNPYDFQLIIYDNKEYVRYHSHSEFRKLLYGYKNPFYYSDEFKQSDYYKINKKNPVARIIEKHSVMDTNIHKKEMATLQEKTQSSMAFFIPVYASLEDRFDQRNPHRIVTLKERALTLMENFRNHLSWKTRKDWEANEAEYDTIMKSLDVFVQSWEKEKNEKNRGKKITFQERYFRQDPEMYRKYIRLYDLVGKQKQLWNTANEEILDYYRQKKEKIQYRILHSKNSLERASLEYELLGPYTFDKRTYEYAYMRSALDYVSVQDPSDVDTLWKYTVKYNNSLFHDQTKIRSEVLSRSLMGVVEIRLFLYDPLIFKDKSINKIIDSGVAVVLRGLFIVFLLATVFVRDIKNLARTSMRVKEGDLTARFVVNTRDELSELADSFNVMVSGMREKEELRHEMITGKIIQEKLLPASDQLTKENRIVFSYRYYPMLGIGGDYIDYLYRSEESVIILNGDVSSHGVSAGLVMTMVRTIIHIMAQKGTPLEDIAREINKIVHRDTPSNMFITLFLADFNPKTKKMDYISCGHNIPFLLRPAGVERLPAGGMALGALPPLIYDKSVKKLSVDMKDGDILVQYTDGLTEATNPDGKMYEDNRLEKILQKIREKGIYDPERILDLISADLKQYSGKNLDKDGFSELDDDVALIVFKVIH